MTFADTENFFDGQEKTNNQLGALIEAPAIYMNLSAFDNSKTKALLFEFQISYNHETSRSDWFGRNRKEKSRKIL